MTRLDQQTRRHAIHVVIALAVGTLMIAGLASEMKERKAYNDYLRKLDLRIERVDLEPRSVIERAVSSYSRLAL
ncbi:MAG: hypothetical protein P8Q36_15060 [Alphaproteobacteria bacterium]|jgi:hypothetical protein|nr:hypothetical protein [Rhodospirillaceae bacterium]MBT6510634.1 hypothetical protein [Rhodospirillaceae bacterium]MBT7613998.1 hypothetical protein [Rhodospirillaceae bacterium]MDG2482166.1 hypothetical protein [Alphaproteobacteria bacterium]